MNFENLSNQLFYPNNNTTLQNENCSIDTNSRNQIVNSDTLSSHPGNRCIFLWDFKIFKTQNVRRVLECTISQTSVSNVCVSYTGIINVGYTITLKYLDCLGCERTITQSGSSLLLVPTGFYTCGTKISIPNSPRIRVCKNEVTVSFLVAACK